MIFLGLILLLGFVAWGIDFVGLKRASDAKAFLVSSWVLSYLIPAAAVITFLLTLRNNYRRFRGPVFGAMLLLVLFQGSVVGLGFVNLKKIAEGGPYSSTREYVPLSSRPSVWPDPLQPATFDLGGGVRLSMSLVCWVDSSKQTLPRTVPKTFPRPEQDTSTRPLTARSLQNLVAFTKAMGYVRFFHPSDEATKVYWNHLAVLGVQAIEDAASPEELAHKLQAFFVQVAPTVQFLAPGETVKNLELPKGATQLVRWRHQGMGLVNEHGGFGFSRSVRLADVAITWTVMQHFYPYFDVVACDWSAELPRALQQAAVDPDDQSSLRTLRKLVAALKDGHGKVSRAQKQDRLVPLLDLRILEGRAYVKAGPKEIPRGSEILAVDGESMPDRLARCRLEISAATEGSMNSRLAWKVVSGCSGPKARLAIRTPQGRPMDVEVALEKYSNEFWAQGLPAQLAELGLGLWYVDLDRIEEGEFLAALPKLAEAKGVIFDLRGYPKMGPRFLQHLTKQPIQSARWNVPVVTEPDGRGWQWNTSGRWNLKPLQPHIKGKVVFLTGGGAISYAESCLGIVEAYKLAEIVGEPSAGTNGNVNPFSLPGGSSVSWTGMKVLKHDGSQHHGIGILPTIPVSPTPKGLAEGRDEVLEKGLEVVAR